jgi:hypothetical protein
MGVGGQRHAPAALPPGKTRYPLTSNKPAFFPHCRTVSSGYNFGTSNIKRLEFVKEMQIFSEVAKIIYMREENHI